MDRTIPGAIGLTAALSDFDPLFMAKIVKDIDPRFRMSQIAAVPLYVSKRGSRVIRLGSRGAGESNSG